MPDWREGNPYEGALGAAVEARGHPVRYAHFPRGWLPLLQTVLRHSPAALHLHWVAPLLAPHLAARPGFRRFVRRALAVLDLRLCRLLGIPVYWTIHNLVSHESADPAWERVLRRQLLRHVTACFVHSASARSLIEQEFDIGLDGRCAVVPHAAYTDEYPAPDTARVAALRAELGLDGGEFVYLFFGAIRPYKGVENLVDAFTTLADTDARLVVAGRVRDAELGAALAARCAGDARIRWREGFLVDDDLAALLALADVVVLPYVQTLTSGSVLLAMTRGKPLILPERGRVFDVPGECGALYFESGHLGDALAAIRERDVIAMGRFNQASTATLTWAHMAALITARYERDATAR
ncbi:MAG: glycosyltransferase [Gammaproteobacteria bacterium]